MRKTNLKEAGPSFGFNDCLYIVCKHKWMLLALTLSGLAAAAVVFMVQC